jgi:hypothetical protein
MPSRRKLLRELSDTGERNWPSPIVYIISASSLMMSPNHCRMTVAAKRDQQWALLHHGLVPASGGKTQRNNDGSNCCYVDIRNFSRKT